MIKRFLWLPLLVIVLDQLSKIIAVKYLFHKPAIEVLPFFNFSLAFNTGAAFGFLHTASGWQNVFFISIALVVSAVIFYMASKLGPKDKWELTALMLILGGALGNVIDRIRIQKVVDFLDFYANNWHFPTFNIADSAITIGAIILILDALGFKFFSNRSKEDN